MTGDLLELICHECGLIWHIEREELGERFIYLRTEMKYGDKQRWSKNNVMESSCLCFFNDNSEESTLDVLLKL